MEFYTEDLGDFGYTQLVKLRDLLDQYIENDLPDGYDTSGLKPAFNMNSGKVFFVNDDFQVAMINPNTNKLEIFYTLSYSGTEGFADELKEMYKDGDITDEDDIEDMRYFGIIEYDDDKNRIIL